MQYLALIYSDETKMPPSDIAAQYGAYTQEIIAAGVFKGGDGLKPTSTATSVKMRGGEKQVTDGPFAETKEQLGGYYLLECDTLDEALKWAAKIPTAQYGTIEVRPLMVYDN